MAIFNLAKRKRYGQGQFVKNAEHYIQAALHGRAREVAFPPLPEAYRTSDYAARVPRAMTAELAELIGYFMGDGSLHAKGIRFCVAQKDHDVVQRLCYLRHRLFGIEAERKSRTSYTELIFTSIRLVLWWEACGLAKTPPTPGHRGKGYPPRVPDAILHTNDPDVYAAFIRGLFEADGTVHNGYVSWTTSTLQFSYDVLRLLLALGFETTREYEHPSP